MTTFLTLEEAAERIRVRPSTVRTYVREGKLPGKRVIGSKQILISEPDVLALLENAREEVPAARGVVKELGKSSVKSQDSPQATAAAVRPTARELRRMSPEEREPYLRASAAFAAPDGPHPHEFEDLETGELWDYDDEGNMVAAKGFHHA